MLIQFNFELKKKIQTIFSNKISKFLFFKPDNSYKWVLENKINFFLYFSKILWSKDCCLSSWNDRPVLIEQKSFKKKIALLLYQKFIFVNSDLINVNSIIEKKNFLKLTKKISKIIVIPHGIYFDKKFKIIKNNKKDLRFIFFSRIHRSKNLDTLVKIWKKDYFFHKFKLDIYGKIVDKNYFNELKIRNVKNINYRGQLNKNIQKLLSKYDVFIHPSNSENFGLVIFESLSSGLYLILNKKQKKTFLEKKKFLKNINLKLKKLKASVRYVLKIKNR